MRARRQPSAPRIERQRLADRRRERDRRRLRDRCARRRWRDEPRRSSAGRSRDAARLSRALPRAERPEHRRGRDRHAGVDEHGEERRQAQGRAEPLAGARPSCGRAIARHTGTSAPVSRAAARIAGSSRARPLRRARSRSAAAASAEPPPRPAATGRRFVRWKAPVRSPGTRRASARAALRTRLSASPPAAFAGRAGDGQAQRARLEAQIVAGAGEGDEAFEGVIAVGAAAEHVERQVDLGRGAGGERMHGL